MSIIVPLIDFDERSLSPDLGLYVLEAKSFASRHNVMQCTYIVDELDQGVGGQLSIVLNDLIIGKDVDAFHLIQAW